MPKSFVLYKNVKLGKNANLQEGVILGLPPSGKKDGELKTIIGDNAVVRSNTVIYSGVEIGDDFQTGHNVVIREDNKIGNNVNIWSNSVIYPHNKIGQDVKIHCNCFVESSVLADGVFLGPQVMIADDPHPVCPRWRDCLGGAKIGKNAGVGGNVTILPGAEIGEEALVGAGSVVTKNVPPKTVVVGNPATPIKKVSELKCFKDFYKVPYEWRKK